MGEERCVYEPQNVVIRQGRMEIQIIWLAKHNILKSSVHARTYRTHQLPLAALLLSCSQRKSAHVLCCVLSHCITCKRLGGNAQNGHEG